MGDDFGQRAAHTFLMNLADFTADAHLTVFAVSLGKLLQRLHQPVGRLVENHGALLLGQTLNLCLTALLLGQKPLEGEAVAGQSAADQSRHESSSTGEALHLHPSPDGLADKKEAWVADAWRAGIADECHVLARQQTVDNASRRSVLVELVVRHELVSDFKMLQQNARRPGILCQHQVHLF